MSLVDLPALRQLSRKEQLELVADLCNHLADRAADDDLLLVGPEEATLLDERLAAHDAASESALTLEEFKIRLAARV